MPVSRLLPVLVLAALTLGSGGARAGEARFVLGPSSRVLLEGSTNVHDWSCRSTNLELSARLNVPPAEALAAVEALEDRVERSGVLGEPPATPDLEATFGLTIPVHELDCGNRRMERDLGAALDADRHPAIRYRFHGVTDVASVPGEDGGPPGLVLVVEGEITLAGARRKVVFPVESRRVGHDRFALRGRIPMTMSEFGIDPPVALLGVIRARDRLVVDVDLLLELEEAPGEAGPAGPRPGAGIDSGAGIEADEALP